MKEQEVLRVTKLSYVNCDQDPQENDLIISSGEGLLFPRGFGLGRIKQWERDGYNCFVTLKPLLDFKKIEYCYLLPRTVQLKVSPVEEVPIGEI